MAKENEEPMIGLVGRRKKYVPLGINLENLGRSSADVEAGAHAYMEWFNSLSEEERDSMLTEASRRMREYFQNIGKP